MLGDYELLRIDNGLVFRNSKNSESTALIDLVPNAVLKDNGIKCTNKAIQNLDISSTLEYQGSENTLEFTLATDSMQGSWNYSLVHVYLEGTESTGYVISVMAKGFGYESGDPFKTSISNYYQTSSYTCSDKNIKIVVKDKKCYFFVNDNLEYTTPELNITNKIVGICIKDRSDGGFYGVAVKDLVLTSNIKYLVYGELMVYDNGVLHTNDGSDQYPTNEITSIENGNVILYTENTAPTTNIESPFVDIPLVNNWEKIEVDLDAKVCFNFDYNTKTTVSSFFCLKINNEKYVRFEVVKLSSSNTYLSFGIDNSSACINWKDFTDSLASYNNDQFNHVHLEITKNNIYAKVTIGANIYEYTTPDLGIQNVKFGLVSGSSELTLVPNFKHEYKNILIKYTNPNLTLDIENPEKLILGKSFTLTADASSDFGTIEYLWDSGETSESINLLQNEAGDFSSSCTVKCNNYSLTKSVEYSVKNPLTEIFRQSENPLKFVSANNTYILTPENAYVENGKLYIDKNKSETIEFPTDYGILTSIEFDSQILIMSGTQLWNHHFYLNGDYKAVLGLGNTWFGLAIVAKDATYWGSGHIKRSDVNIPSTTSTFDSHIKIEIKDNHLICSRTLRGTEYVCDIDVSDLGITQIEKAKLNQNDEGSSWKIKISIENMAFEYQKTFPGMITFYKDSEIVSEFYDAETYKLCLTSDIDIESVSVKFDGNEIETSIDGNKATAEFSNPEIGEHVFDINFNDEFTKTLKIDVNKGGLFLNGKVIAFQNTLSPNLFYNITDDEISTELADISYFETNNNRLYFYSTSSSQTYRANYQTPSYNLRTFKNNVTIEYNLYCPRASVKEYYPRAPIMNLRISETQYISVYNYTSLYNSSVVNIFDAYLVTSNGSGYTGSRYGYTSGAFATDNEAKVKIDITPASVTLNIYFDGKTLTRVYNATVDKKYLEFILFHKYGDNSTNQYLRTNTEFYISDFIAYETGYEITDEDKQAINELMVSQNNDYIAEHGITTVPAPVVKFKDVPLEGEVCKTVTLDASQSTQENGFIKSYSWDTGETTSSITVIYIDKTYTVTVTGKAHKTATGSITLKGTAPEFDEHVMWKLNPYNAKYFYYRDNDIKSSESRIDGTYSLSGASIVASSGQDFFINIDDSIDQYNYSLCKLTFKCSFNKPSGTYFCVYLKNGYCLYIYSSSVELYDNFGNKLSNGSISSAVLTDIIIKGNIIELYQSNSLRFKYIANISDFTNMKFDKIKGHCPDRVLGNIYGPIYLSDIEIRSIDVAEPNIGITSSNENAECFENVVLTLGVDQPCELLCNGEITNPYITEQLVESKIYNIKATNKLDNSLYKEIEYTQNVKELVNDINIKNEFGLVKLYQNQNVDVEYKLPTTLPENAVIKYYIDGKEVK